MSFTTLTGEKKEKNLIFQEMKKKPLVKFSIYLGSKPLTKLIIDAEFLNLMEKNLEISSSKCIINSEILYRFSCVWEGDKGGPYHKFYLSYFRSQQLL